MNLDEQQAILAPHADAAAQLLWSRLSSRFEQIVELADARIIAGYEVFGAAMFEYDAERLWRDVDEELADAINYLRVIVSRLCSSVPVVGEPEAPRATGGVVPSINVSQAATSDLGGRSVDALDASSIAPSDNGELPRAR